MEYSNLMKDEEYTQKFFNNMNQVSNYKDGKKNGTETNRYPSGQKSSEGSLLNGKKECVWTEWYENGQLIAKEYYKNGEVIKL